MNAMINDIHRARSAGFNSVQKMRSELVSILQEVDVQRAYLHFDASSLYDYCVRVLKLSERISYGLISIARSPAKRQHYNKRSHAANHRFKKLARSCRVLTKGKSGYVGSRS